MATIFALIFVPSVIAIIGMLFGTMSGVAGYIAVTAFTVLAAGLFVGLLRLARRWEDEVLE